MNAEYPTCGVCGEQCVEYFAWDEDDRAWCHSCMLTWELKHGRRWEDGSQLSATADKGRISGSTDTDLRRENKRLRCELATVTAQRNRFERLLTERKEKVER